MEKLKIDGIGISEWQLFISNNSYNSLLTFPKLKQISQNDWAEFDGIEVDLEQTAIDSRTLNLNFFTKEKRGYVRFLEYLKSQVYHEFYFCELDRYYKLRINDNSVKNLQGFEEFSISFAEDNPLFGYEKAMQEEDFLDLQKQSNFIFNDKDFSKYGITILDSSLKSILQFPKIKQRLSINQKYENGIWYDDLGSQFYENKNINLSCLIRNTELKKTIKSYYDFMKIITSPNEKNLYLRNFDKGFSFYYENSNVKDVCNKLTSGLAGIRFDLNLKTI